MTAILVINPGSTSTKLAVFSNHKCLKEQTLRHKQSELKKFPKMIDQLPYRFQFVEKFITMNDLQNKMIAVVGRGGLLHPLSGGTYRVNEEMIKDLTEEKYNTHASNLGAILADKVSKRYDIPAFIVDPVVVDELQDLARISGLQGMERRSVCHVLNQKAVARKIGNQIGKDYKKSTIIVAHLGGGISIGIHKEGKMIDMFNGLDGEGPYTPERSGSLPLLLFAQKVIQEELSLEDVKTLISKNAGLQSYLKENDIQKIEKRMQEGDEQAKFYLDGMCYQIGKCIGALSTIARGKIDFIVLTGGICYSKYVRSQLISAIDWLAPVYVYPGEMEMEALYEGTYRVMRGEEKVHVYYSE